MKSSEECRKKEKTSLTDNSVIYRIIPFQRLAELLVTKKNTFVNPSLWDDPFEGWTMEEICSILSVKQFEIPPCSSGKFFGQCWTSDYASEALWQIYSKGTDGFRIRTTVGKLKASLGNEVNNGNVVVDEVEYRDTGSLKFCDFIDPSKLVDESFLIQSLAKTYMVKRKAYKHEYEVRFIVYCQKPKDDKLFTYKIHPNKLIDQIMIHSDVSDKDFKKLKRIIKELGFKIKVDGETKIKKSTIHALPKKLGSCK